MENDHHQAFFYRILKIKVKCFFLFERSLKYYNVYVIRKTFSIETCSV